MSHACGPVKGCVARGWLATIQERRLVLEEQRQVLDGVVLVLFGGLDEKFLPGLRGAGKHLIQEFCPTPQHTVPRRTFHKYLNTVNSA